MVKFQCPPPKDSIPMRNTNFFCSCFIKIAIPFKFNKKPKLKQDLLLKVPHTGNTRLSCACLIQESMSIPQVHVYTMSPCPYHEFMSIPGVHVHTMSPCLYHESMCIPWVHVYTIPPCHYYESMCIPWVHVYTKSPCINHKSMSIPWVHEKKMITKLPFLEKQRYKTQEYRNAKY